MAFIINLCDYRFNFVPVLLFQKYFFLIIKAFDVKYFILVNLKFKFNFFE